MTKDTGIVNIHGKEYKTVAKRVDEFRKEHSTNLSIITEIISTTDNMIVMKASIIDREGITIATGFAEENRTSSSINKTSALENCETSAIGRALANFGLGGGEYASADEIANAINTKAPEVASKASNVNFDFIKETLASIDDMESIDNFAKEVAKKYPNMTAKQANAVSATFNARREELKQCE